MTSEVTDSGGERKVSKTASFLREDRRKQHLIAQRPIFCQPNNVKSLTRPVIRHLDPLIVIITRSIHHILIYPKQLDELTLAISASESRSLITEVVGTRQIIAAYQPKGSDSIGGPLKSLEKPNCIISIGQSTAEGRQEAPDPDRKEGSEVYRRKQTKLIIAAEGPTGWLT